MVGEIICFVFQLSVSLIFSYVLFFVPSRLLECLSFPPHFMFLSICTIHSDVSLSQKKTSLLSYSISDHSLSYGRVFGPDIGEKWGRGRLFSILHFENEAEMWRTLSKCRHF